MRKGRRYELNEALEAGAIVPYDEGPAPRYMKYMPFWAELYRPSRGVRSSSEGVVDGVRAPIVWLLVLSHSRRRNPHWPTLERA